MLRESREAALQREVDLLWVALEEERLVVKTKNDVIASLQSALAASMSASPGGGGGASRMPHGAGVGTAPWGVTGPAVVSLGALSGVGAAAGLSRHSVSSSVPPVDDDERLVEARIDEAVQATVARCSTRHRAEKVDLVEELETAHRVDLRAAQLAAHGLLLQLARAEGELVATSLLVRTQLGELHSARASLRRALDAGAAASQQAASLDLERAHAAAASELLCADRGDALAAAGALVEGVAAAACAVLGADDRDSREQQLVGRIAAHLEATVAGLATEHVRSCEALLIDADRALKAVAARRTAWDAMVRWHRAAAAVRDAAWEERCSLYSDAALPVLGGIARAEVERANSNVFALIAAAKAKQSSSPAPSPSAEAITSDHHGVDGGVAVPIAAQRRESELLARIRQLEERGTQKAKLLASSTRRIEELEGALAAQCKVVEAMQRVPQLQASASPPPGSVDGRKRRSLEDEEEPGGGVDADGAEGADENADGYNARAQATLALRKQLELQTQLLAKLEGAERTEIHQRDAAFVAAVLCEVHERVSCEMLHMREDTLDDWFVELSDAVRGERRRIAEEARFRQQHQRLVSAFGVDQETQPSPGASLQDGGGGGGGSHDGHDDTLIQWPSLSFALRRGGLAQLSPSASQEAVGADIAGAGHFSGSAAAAAAVASDDVATALVLITQGLFLHQKRQLLKDIADAHAALFDCFIVFAPRLRAPETIRVQVAEGALALTEAQRDQALSVARWLTTECSNACANLAALMQRTDPHSAGAHDGGGTASGGRRTPDASSRRGVSSPVLTVVAAGNRDPATPLGGVSRDPSPVPGALRNPEITGNSFASLGSVAEVFAASAATRGGGAADVVARTAAESNLFDMERVQGMCDRMLEGVAGMHERLVQAEIALGEAQVALQERTVHAEQYHEMMVHATVAQCVEREISDDALLALRQHIVAERDAARCSIVELLDENEARNVSIRELQSACRGASSSAHSGALMAQYCFHAFQLQLERIYEYYRRDSILLRLSMIPSPMETAFLLLLVHSKLGEALTAAQEASFGAFHDFSARYVALIREREAYTQQALKTAEELLALQRERRLERLATQLLEAHVRTALVEFAATSHEAELAAFFAVIGSLREAVSDRIGATAAAAAAEARRDEMAKALQRVEQAAEECEIALSVANERAAAAEEAIAARDEELTRVAARAEEALKDAEQAAEARLRMAEEHQLFEQLVVAERQASELAAQREEALQHDRDALAATIEALRGELDSAQGLLDREKEAHRATIRSFALHNLSSSSGGGGGGGGGGVRGASAASTQ